MPDKRGKRWYGLRHTSRGSYTVLGRPVLVRTFGSEQERTTWLAEQADPSSILFDGRREAVSGMTEVTERGTGRTMHISEAVPGL